MASKTTSNAMTAKREVLRSRSVLLRKACGPDALPKPER